MWSLQSIKAELRKWSFIHFLFDALISTLCAYVFSLVVSISAYQLAILAGLSFATVFTGSLVWQNHRRSLVPSHKVAEDKARVAEIEQRLVKMIAMRAQLTEFAKYAPSSEVDDGFWPWVRGASAWLCATCKPEISSEFGSIVDHGKDPNSCRQFLIGLATSLSEDDLRRPREESHW